MKRLTVVDEYTRKCLALAVRRRLTSRDVQEHLSEVFLLRGCPMYLRSDNGAEFIGTGPAGLVSRLGGEVVIHQTGQSMGERVCRVL